MIRRTCMCCEWLSTSDFSVSVKPRCTCCRIASDVVVLCQKLKLSFVLCRRAQLRHYLEQLKKQVPLPSDSVRNTTQNLLREAQLHIKVNSRCLTLVILTLPAAHSCPPGFQNLQEQDERAERLKDRLRWEQRELRVRLEQLQRGSERMRNNSYGSTMSSERSDSDRGGWGWGLPLALQQCFMTIKSFNKQDLLYVNVCFKIKLRYFLILSAVSTIHISTCL